MKKPSIARNAIAVAVGLSLVGSGAPLTALAAEGRGLSTIRSTTTPQRPTMWQP